MPQRKDSIRSFDLPKVSVLSKSEKISLMFYELKKTKLDRVLVKDKENLIGVVTLRDIFIKLASKKFSNISPTSLSVAAFTSERFVSISQDMTLSDAISTMNKENVSALPVIGTNGKVQGLLTKNMLINLLSQELHGKVEDFLVRGGYRVPAGTSLSTVINDILRDKDMREFVVIQNTLPLGVVGEKELATFLFKYLSEDTIHHMRSALQKYVTNDIMTLIIEKLRPQDPVQKAATLLSNTNLVMYPVTKEESLVGVIRRRELFNQLLT